MLLFSDDESQILKQIPLDDDSEFRQKNPVPLKNLYESHVQLTKTFDPEKQINYVSNCHAEFVKGDFMNQLITLNKTKGNKEKEFESMMQPFKEKIQPVKNDIQQAFPMFYNICDIANKINASKPKNSGNSKNSQQVGIQKAEELAMAADIVNSIKLDFENGLKFYSQLGHMLEELKKMVDDFTFAREVESQTIIEEIEAENNYANMNTSKPFFQKQQTDFVAPHRKKVVPEDNNIINNNNQ